MSDHGEQSELMAGLTGLLTEAGHRLAARVYYADTDFSGVVYHARYLEFLERGRSDFLRLAGVHHTELADGKHGERITWVVRRMEIDFVSPARIDDVLEVTTRVRSMTAATLVLSQSVSREGLPLCEAEVTVVLVSASGRVLRLSAGLKARLATRIDGG